MFSVLRTIRPSRDLIVQATSAGALAVTGDLICQKFVEKVERIDITRSLKFGFVISCMTAPIQYKWFKMLEARIHSKTKLGTGIKRMLLDQTIAAPLLTSMVIFMVQVVNGHSLEYAAARLRTTIVPVLATNYKVWPIIQTLNMSVVPLAYRLVFVQFIAIFWNIYLASMVSKKD